MGCLYRIDFPNGRSYIGMTVCEPRKRFNEHRYQARIGGGMFVHAAMRKYGLEHVRFNVLVVADDRQYLEQLERSAISAFGTRFPHGYNLTDGGDGAPQGNQFQLGKKRSAESRMRMSATRKGRVLSPEHRDAVRRALIGNTYCRGRALSEEERERWSRAQRGAFKGAASGITGVSFDRQTSRWRASLTVGGTTINLGRFSTVDEAADARKSGERKYFA